MIVECDEVTFSDGREFVHISQSMEVTCHNKLRQSFAFNQGAVCKSVALPVD